MVIVIVGMKVVRTVSGAVWGASARLRAARWNSSRSAGAPNIAAARLLLLRFVIVGFLSFRDVLGVIGDAPAVACARPASERWPHSTGASFTHATRDGAG